MLTSSRVRLVVGGQVKGLPQAGAQPATDGSPAPPLAIVGDQPVAHRRGGEPILNSVPVERACSIVRGRALAGALPR